MDLSKVKIQMDIQMKDRVWADRHIRDRIGYPIWSKLWNQVIVHIRDRIYREVWEHIENQIDIQVGDQVGEQIKIQLSEFNN